MHKSVQVLKNTIVAQYWANLALHSNIIEGFYQFENTFSETFNSGASTSTMPTMPAVNRPTTRRGIEVSKSGSY